MCPSDDCSPVDVGPDVLWSVIIHNAFDTVDVDPSGCCVCADQPVGRHDSFLFRGELTISPINQIPQLCLRQFNYHLKTIFIISYNKDKPWFIADVREGGCYQKGGQRSQVQISSNISF